MKNVTLRLCYREPGSSSSFGLGPAIIRDKATLATQTHAKGLEVNTAVDLTNEDHFRCTWVPSAFDPPVSAAGETCQVLLITDAKDGVSI